MKPIAADPLCNPTDQPQRRLLSAVIAAMQPLLLTTTAAFMSSGGGAVKRWSRERARGRLGKKLLQTFEFEYRTLFAQATGAAGPGLRQATLGASLRHGCREARRPRPRTRNKKRGWMLCGWPWLLPLLGGAHCPWRIFAAPFKGGPPQARPTGPPAKRTQQRL